ncbi:rab-GTPase-TBC domain-containing protein [Russula earlei]|uniref:Rab-GTPase-TBC domain-containing protein n=1 Tax=Russula earlei TaxID=71964 RepID=A0ACC0UNS4_9AGAM|nr:rab-GTPase-TBC domain-containing protein [Russula earlei]
MVEDIPKNPSFSLDDAFSDTDDNDPSIEFSSIAIRADLARAVSYSQVNEGLGDAEELPYLDAAGDTTESLPEPPSDGDISSPALDVNQLSAKFDSVSLSESPVEKPSNEEDHHDIQNRPGVTENRHGRRHSRNDGDSEVRHHAVCSDESHAPLDASQESQLSSSPPEQTPDTPVSVSESERPIERPTGQTVHIRTPSQPSTPVTTPSTASTPPLPLPFHKPTRSTGPSVFERVISKTRPSFLPPKSKNEDQKHMADWENMMKRSRAAEEKRRNALQERRLARELHVEQSLNIWEKEILPDWKIVYRNSVMRKLWWAGIPTKLRATMWERAVGNSLALSQDTYRICLARANRALSAGTFPTTSLGLIEQDVQNTLPSLHIFSADSGPMYADLKDMLYAWVVSRSDEGLGYVPGTARIAAMILLNMSAGPGFIVLKNLLERHCMRSFYGGLSTKDDVEAYYRIFDTLLADGMPKTSNLPSAYLRDWIVPLFIDHLPFEACARLWDVILLEGDAFLYRACLAMLAVLESRLFFPDNQELLDLLRGENKAALEVARREGRPMNGGKYEIYGVDEETLWDRIEFMDNWWKESTWNRLLRRELPDI